MRTREHFDNELRDLEDEILRLGTSVRHLFQESLEALESANASLCDDVIAGDDDVDAAHLKIEGDVLQLLALESPVASDLRLVATVLHINLHLERVADLATNIARISKLTAVLPRNAEILGHLEDMGAIALHLLYAAMQSFANRDLALAGQLASIDQSIDRLDHGMLAEVLRAGKDGCSLEWAIEMHLVSRMIERVGDHAVDIGEHVTYLVSGLLDGRHSLRRIEA
jgi:phosphate transport system protein